MNGVDLSQLLDIDKLLLSSALSPLQILLSLSITFLMSIFIYCVYKKTYNGVLYSKNFNLTLIMTALIVNAIVIGISGNIILSLGMVGALSIIRFRTAIKDPKDTAFLFWAITIGVINGVSYYELSLIASLFVAIVLFFLSKKGISEPSYMLILKYRDEAYENLEPLLNRYFSKYLIRSDSNTDQYVEKVIEVRLKPKLREEALKDIRGVKGLESCVLLSNNGEFAE
ncbi:MAG: DUF4956 domain-containing protein [Patescibacteria group bacterium]